MVGRGALAVYMMHRWRSPIWRPHVPTMKEYLTRPVEERLARLVLGEYPPDRDRWGLRSDDDLPLNPARWAEEPQYLRNDAGLALVSLRRRRRELLASLKRLSPEQWKRGSVHVTLGR
jgi:hypothetical protein